MCRIEGRTIGDLQEDARDGEKVDMQEKEIEW